MKSWVVIACVWLAGTATATETVWRRMYPRQYESVDWLVADSDAVVVGTLRWEWPENRLVLDISEVIKAAEGLPASIRYPHGRTSTAEQWLNEGSPLLLFLTRNTSSQGSSWWTSRIFTPEAAICMREPIEPLLVSQDLRFLRGREELLTMVREAARRKDAPQRHVILPIDRRSPLLNLVDEGVVVSREGWLKSGAEKWLASDDHEVALLAMDHLARHFPVDAPRLLRPLLEDERTVKHGSPLGAVTRYPLRHAAWQVLQMSDPNLPVPTVETPSLGWRIGRIVVPVAGIGAFILMPSRAKRGQMRSHLRGFMIGIIRLAVVVLIVLAVLLAGLVVIRYRGTLVVNTGAGTVWQFRLAGNQLEIERIGDYPIRLSELTLIDGGATNRIVPGEITVLASHRRGPFSFSTGSVGKWTLVSRLPGEWWQVRFPTAIVIGLLSVPLLIWVISLAIARHRRRRQDNMLMNAICAHCGYDLRHTSTRCPECGTRTVPAHEWIKLLKD